MSTTVEKISSNKVKLSFDIDAAKFDEAMGKAYIKVRGQVAIPGFRKGHAPRKMIENMYGEGVFYDEAFELIFDEVYGPAIDENKLEVVDRPQVDIQQIGAGKNLQFTCEVFVKPDVTLGEYKGVEVKREHTLVTEDEVNAEIEKERNKQAAEVAVDDRPVAEGDTVNLDYSGSVDGVKFAGGTAENQTLKIGSHTFIPGFEEQMVGMTIGEEKDLNVTNAVIGKVMENATVEIPEAMIERQIDSMIRNFEARLAQQGLKLADFMKYTGQDEKSFRGQYRDQAEKSVRANLVLEAIENVENFEVSDEEIDAEIEKFAKQIGQSVEELKKNLTEGDREYFKADVIRDKAVKFLCDNAKAE